MPTSDQGWIEVGPLLLGWEDDCELPPSAPAIRARCAYAAAGPWEMRVEVQTGPRFCALVLRAYWFGAARMGSSSISLVSRVRWIPAWSAFQTATRADFLFRWLVFGFGLARGERREGSKMEVPE